MPSSGRSTPSKKKQLTGVKKSKTCEDVQASTSLPPAVEGSHRSFLKVSIKSINWVASGPPDSPLQVRIKWWGETGNGTFFRPKVTNIKSVLPKRTTAFFPVKSTAKQFLAYLNDMSVLHLDVLCGSDNSLVGRCVVPQVSQINFNAPLSGYFAAFSSESEKIAEIHAVFTLQEFKPLAGDYSDVVSSFDAGSVSSIPVSSNAIPTPHNAQTFRVIQPMTGGPDIAPRLENPVPIPQPSFVQNLLPSATPENDLPPDLISLLLQKGNNLREAIVRNTAVDDSAYTAAPKSGSPGNKENTGFRALGDAGKEVKFMQPSSTELLQQHLAQQTEADASLDFDTGLEFHDLVYKFDKKRLTKLCAKNKDSTNVGDSLSEDDNQASDSDNPLRDSSLIKSLMNRNAGLTSSDTSDSDYCTRARPRRKSSKKLSRKLRRSVSSDSSVDRVDELRLQEERVLAELSSKVKSAPIYSDRSGENGSVDDADNDIDDVTGSISIDRLTLLEKVTKAMVIIDTFAVSGNIPATNKGRPPPRPVFSKNSEYYVEYQFPNFMPKQPIAHKPVKVNCRQTSESSVMFSHRSVFPFCIDSSNLKNLWGVAITFHLFAKSPNAVTPKLIGSGAVKLNSIFTSDYFASSLTLPLKKFFAFKKKKTRRSEDEDAHTTGNLKLSIEFTSDSSGFSNFLTRLKTKEASNPVMISVKGLGVKPPSQKDVSTVQVERHSEPLNQPHRGEIFVQKENLDHAEAVSSVEKVSAATEIPGEAFFFYFRVGTSEISANFMSKKSKVTLEKPDKFNFYVNTRVFWLDEHIKSDVCWNKSNPDFNVDYTIPMFLTQAVLDRMKNNYVFVEVWNKRTTASDDELVGLAKLPLSQFHMSFSNSRFIHVLKDSHYPVIGADSTFDIVNPVSGQNCGKLATTMAIGTSEQVAALKDIKTGDPNAGFGNRKFFQIQTEPDASPSKELSEHTFEIVINGVKHLNQFSDDIHGEADCFVQYLFPDQDTFTFNQNEMSFVLKKFKTSTTLCVPDAVFHDVIHHKLIFPSNLLLQKELIRSFTSSSESKNSLVFEVWTRYYHPNLRDQLIACGELPLPKLCSLITMHKHGNPSCQNFTLPLSRPGESVAHCGMLDATVSYKSVDFGSVTSFRGFGLNTQVVLRVQILRACGLEEAIMRACKTRSGLDYYTTVGVNSYFKVALSFTGDDARKTRTVAHSFAPETGSILEFPLPIFFKDDKSSVLVSLAERLEVGECLIELWHQVPADEDSEEKPEDVLLGSTSVSLMNVLIKSTGVRGWNALYSEAEDDSEKGTLVGGVDLNISFARNDDREKVVQAGKGAGWSSNTEIAGALIPSESYKLTLCLFELNCFRKDLTGNLQSKRSTKCYVRYKFYDRPAACTYSASLRNVGGAFLTRFDYREAFNVTITEPIKYYLSEEPLELQIWVAGDQSSTSRGRKDKYFGSAFLDMSSLNKDSQVYTVSDSCQIYKAGANNIGSGQLRVSMTIEKTSISDHTNVQNCDNDSVGEEEEDEDEKEEPVDLSNTFKARVEIERAYHLSSESFSEVNTSETKLYFTFQITGKSKPITTEMVDFAVKPVWNFSIDSYLSNEHLDSANPVIFKLWYHAEGTPDKVFGFVAVDASTLNSSGFSQVSGFYNITNFSNQSLGQVKLSIIPMDGFQRKSAVELKAVSRVSKDPDVPEKPVTSKSMMGVPAFTNDDLQKRLSELELLKVTLRERVQKQIQGADELLQHSPLDRMGAGDRPSSAASHQFNATVETPVSTVMSPLTGSVRHNTYNVARDDARSSQIPQPTLQSVDKILHEFTSLDKDIAHNPSTDEKINEKHNESIMSHYSDAFSDSRYGENPESGDEKENIVFNEEPVDKYDSFFRPVDFDPEFDPDSRDFLENAQQQESDSSPESSHNPSIENGTGENGGGVVELVSDDEPEQHPVQPNEDHPVQQNEDLDISRSHSIGAESDRSDHPTLVEEENTHAGEFVIEDQSAFPRETILRDLPSAQSIASDQVPEIRTESPEEEEESTDKQIENLEPDRDTPQLIEVAAPEVRPDSPVFNKTEKLTVTASSSSLEPVTSIPATNVFSPLSSIDATNIDIMESHQNVSVVEPALETFPQTVVVETVDHVSETASDLPQPQYTPSLPQNDNSHFDIRAILSPREFNEASATNSPRFSDPGIGQPLSPLTTQRVDARVHLVGREMDTRPVAGSVRSKVSARTAPSVEEAKRIARIFSTKYS